MRALNPDHLRSFVEVIEQGSFSAAARRQKLTQPAVSQHVRELERRLGVRLIERVGKRAHPTAAGTELLIHAREIASVVGRAIDAMASHQRELRGRVRLGTGATACIYLLPRVLRGLRQRFPSLEIVISTGNTSDLLAQIASNTLDVALVTLPATGRNFSVTPVMDDELVAIFPAGEPCPPTAVKAGDFRDRSIVLYEPGGNTRRVIDEWFMRSGISLRPVMELGSVEAIKRLIAAGLGCAILPLIAVRDERRTREVVVRPLSPRLRRQLGIVLRQDKPLDRGLQKVVQALRDLGPK